MNKNFLIKIAYQFPMGCMINPDESVEVSLDCSTCKKRYRTVVITKHKSECYCTPTKHPFNAVIKEIDVNKTVKRNFLLKKELTEIVYHIEYDYDEFVDERNKYAPSHSSPLPSWARVYFNITCPECNHTQKQSTQNNIVRPLKVFCEKCSSLLYKEKVELPIFKMRI